MGSTSLQDDRSLVQRMLAGEERAFDSFFQAYFPPLYRFALARTNCNEDAAEEVVQAALCRAVTKLQTFRGEASLLTWLCTFCRHEISSFYEHRRHLRREVSLTEDVPEIRAALESMAAFGAQPDHGLRRQELARLVHVALDHLPAHYGQALEWKYIQGMPVNEIASRFHLGPKAAESLLVRARQAFREGFSVLSRGPTATADGD